MDEYEINEKLEIARHEHETLNRDIRNLESEPYGDRLKLQRLKKRKMQLKERIIMLENMLTPDMPA